MGLSIFMPLTKVDVEKREVWGVLAEEKKDKSDEIFDYAGSKPYFKNWNDAFSKATAGKSVGNLRSMHTTIAAGKFIAMDYDDSAKRISVGAKVVDDAEWQKVVEGVYTGFSIGGSYIKRWRDDDADAVRYIADPAEGSLVDNPCMYGATFELVRADGVVDMVKFHSVKEEKTVADLANEFKKALTGNELNKAFSFDEIRDKVRAAINSGNMPYMLFGSWAYIVAIYADTLIVQVDDCGSRMYSLGYSLDKKGAVTLDVQSVVEVRTEYVPISDTTGKSTQTDMTKTVEGDNIVEEKDTETVDKSAETVDNEKVVEKSEEKPAETVVEGQIQTETAADVNKSVMISGQAVDTLALIKFLMEDGSVIVEAVKSIEVQLEKAGARNSKADSETVQKMHDHSCTLGAKCKGEDEKVDKDDDGGAEKAAKSDLTKGTPDKDKDSTVEVVAPESELGKLIKGFKSLEKALNDLKGENEGLVNKVKALEALPDDSKSPTLKSVDKSLGGVDTESGADEATTKISALKSVLSQTNDPMVRQAISQELAVLSMANVNKSRVM